MPIADNVVMFKDGDTEEPPTHGYIILFNEEIEDLELDVATQMEDGWKPLGPPFVAKLGEGYCQAMTWGI